MAYGRNSRGYGRKAGTGRSGGGGSYRRPAGRTVRRASRGTRRASGTRVTRAPAQTIKIVLQTAPEQAIASPLLAPLQKEAPKPQKAKF